MKRFYMLCVAAFSVFATFNLNAQSQRLVFVEEATNASCGPCASQNPAFDALLAANSDKVVVLKYQWYFPGFDQMHNDNVEEANGRVAYYGINGVPHGVIDGTSVVDDCNGYEGAPACFSQADFDAAYAVPSEFDMTISAEIVNGELQVTGNIEATAAVAAGDLKLRIALTEKEITTDDITPGSNGETEFFHVMKKFVGGDDGIALENTWAVGDTYEINQTLSVGSVNIYNFDELEVVAFIQDDTGKAVHQAAVDSEVDITVDLAVNSVAGEVTDLPASICSGAQSIAPSFVLENGGNDALTSATITYSINGGDEVSYDWTGDISTLGSETVTLPSYDFNAVALNVVEVEVSNPNGVTDEDLSDNAASGSFGLSPEGTEVVTVTVVADNYGAETYWEIVGDDGTVHGFGGNPNATVGGQGGATGGYANNSTNVAEVTVPATGCYTFRIIDDYGDGICCQYGDGSYSVADAEGNVLFSGSEFGAETAHEYEVTTITSVEVLEEVSGLVLSPNPVADKMMVNFNLAEQTQIKVGVYNAVGQMVQSFGTENYAAGANQLEVDAANLPNGVYMFYMTSADKVITQKFTVSK